MRETGVRLAVLTWAGVLVVGLGRPAMAADCNLNGIPDSCDIDCGPRGGECYVPGCGGSVDVDPQNGIPDECEGCPTPAVFTSTDDFTRESVGSVHRTLINLDSSTSGQLQRSELPRPLPNLWVAASARGTIVRIDTETGEILGEYFTAPDGRGRDPSRTSVNLDGEVWVSNRGERVQFGGSVTKVGLVVGGTSVETWCERDNRITLAPPFEYNTCSDRNGDGYITTSGGLVPLPWPNPEPDGDPVFGSVDTAVDECIVRYVPVSGRNTRHVSVDKDNNLWVGGSWNNNAFDLLDGFTGEIIEGKSFDVGCGGYGGLIDCNDVLWSVSRSGNPGLFWYDTNQDIADTACCEADMRADLNGDGIIDDDDEALEETEALIFPVNSDDDNSNDIPDFDDDGPVDNEDDLQEIQLFTGCYPNDPNAWWSLSWVDPDPDGDPDTDTIKLWLEPDKSDGEGGSGTALVRGEQHDDWPPPPSVWLEALDTYDEIEIAFTISYDEARTQKTDRVKTNAPCSPARPRYWIVAEQQGNNVNHVSADITTHLPLSLCGGPATGIQTQSNIFVNIADFTDPYSGVRNWVQTGYQTERLRRAWPLPPHTKSFRYIEGVVGWSDNAQTYQTRYYAEMDQPTAGVHTYTILSPSPLFGTWFFYFDSLPEEFLVEDPVWVNHAGDFAEFESEIMHLEDQVAGTVQSPCIFSDCRWGLNWTAPGQATNFTAGDVGFHGNGTPGSAEWAYQILSPTSFQIWDLNP